MRELKFFVPLDVLEAHFHFEFQDPIPKIGASQTRVLSVGKF